MALEKEKKKTFTDGERIILLRKYLRKGLSKKQSQEHIKTLSEQLKNNTE